MQKLIQILFALGFIAATASMPAFAQKQSCQEACAKRCEGAAHRNFCMPNCISKCNIKRSEKK